MHRIDTLNARANANGPGKAGYSFNDDLVGVDPTYMDPDWMNAVQEEILSPIEAAGIPPTKGTNNQLLAAIRKIAFDAAYPIGTPYFNKVDDRNPALILGYGTWTREEGRVLVGFKSGDTEFGSAGATGGSKTHTLSESEMPAHTHKHSANIAGTGGGTNQNWYSADYNAGASYNFDSGSTGGGLPHNNIQPYVVYHWWVRTA